jgi:hypothetical protein
MTTTMVPVGRINQSMKLLLIECKRLTGTLPDVEHRDKDVISLGVIELARLTTEFTDILEETNAADKRIFSDAMIQGVKSHVQAFITLIKEFISNSSYDDDKTNDGRWRCCCV